MLDVAIFLILTITLPILGLTFGQRTERKHLRELDRREAEIAGFVINDLRRPSTPMGPHQGVLVAGSVVIASDRAKQIVASLRGIVGGEVKSYQSVLSRARREAMLRMITEARSHGATTVINMRMTTSSISGTSSRSVGGNSAEILCYGTALIPDRPPASPSQTALLRHDGLARHDGPGGRDALSHSTAAPVPSAG